MTASTSEIQRLIECSICCDYLREVRETPCCHNLFCRNCIENWLRKPTRQCPRCRFNNLFEENLLANVVIDRFVDRLQFECSNKVRTCSFKGNRTEIEKHRTTCAFSVEKLEEEKRSKLKEQQSLLMKFRQGKTEISDNALFELAKTFLTERQFNNARECSELIRDKKKFDIVEFWIVQGECERHAGKFDKSLEFYHKAYSQVRVLSQRIELLITIGQLFIKTAQFEKAQDYFSRANDLLPSDDRSSKKIEILNALGLVAKKCSDYENAIRFYNEALKIVDFDSMLWAEINSNLADIHRKKSDFDEAEKLYLQSLKQSEAILGQVHPTIAEIQNNLAVLLKKKGQYEQALDHLKNALKINKLSFGPDHPSVGICLTNIGDIYRKQGDLKSAESTYEEALICLEKSYGPNHIEVAELLNSMGLLLKKRAEYDRAERFYRRAIDIVRQTFGEEKKHYKLGIFLNNLADLDRKRFRFQSALELYQQALSSIEETLGPGHVEAGEIHHNIGQVYHQLGDFKRAIEQINQALLTVKHQYGDKHYKYGMFLNSLGLSYAMNNDLPMALVHLRQASQILTNALGPNHFELGDVYFNLGDVILKNFVETEEKKGKSFHDRQIKLDEAKQHYSKAFDIFLAAFGVDHTKTRQLSSLIFIVGNYQLCST